MTDTKAERPLDLTAPVQTREGNSVRILATNRKGRYPVVGLVLVGDREDLSSWTDDGRPHERIAEELPGDLVNVPQQRTVWVNVYGGKIGMSTLAHPSREAAEKAAIDSSTRIACIRVTYTEGQFDE